MSTGLICTSYGWQEKMREILNSFNSRIMRKFCQCLTLITYVIFMIFSLFKSQIQINFLIYIYKVHGEFIYLHNLHFKKLSSLLYSCFYNSKQIMDINKAAKK